MLCFCTANRGGVWGGGGEGNLGGLGTPILKKQNRGKKIEIYCQEMKTGTLDRASLYFLL